MTEQSGFYDEDYYTYYEMSKRDYEEEMKKHHKFMTKLFNEMKKDKVKK